MAKIIGNTTATPMAVPDWLQENETKADYIKNKPTLGDLASKNIVERSDLSTEVQECLENVEGALNDAANGILAQAKAYADTKIEEAFSELEEAIGGIINGSY